MSNNINDVFKRKFPKVAKGKPRVGQTEKAGSRILWILLGAFAGAIAWNYGSDIYRNWQSGRKAKRLGEGAIAGAIGGASAMMEDM